MFVIREQQRNQYFCYQHSKVIAFDDPNEAGDFAQNFFNFAMLEATKMQFNGNPEIIFDVMSAMNSTIVEELPAEYEFEIINFSDIKKERNK